MKLVIKIVKLTNHLLCSQYVAIHLKNFSDKYHLLWYVGRHLNGYLLMVPIIYSVFFCSYMVRKLHAFVSGSCCEESNDNLMFQEVLLPGTLYLSVLRVSLSDT